MKRFKGREHLKRVMAFGVLLGLIVGLSGVVSARSPVFLNRNEEYSLDVSGSLSAMQLYGVGLKYQYKPHTYLTLNVDLADLLGNNDLWTGVGLQNRFPQDFYGVDFYAGAGMTYIKSSGNFRPYLLSGVGYFVFFAEYQLLLSKDQPGRPRLGLRLNF